jgi:AraC-like DNA-binding protein
MSRLSLNWIHVVALLGALQGVMLAGVLAARRRNRTANRVLGAAMLAFSLGLATDVYHGAGLERAFPHFFGVGYPLLFLYGPLVWLYAVTAADRERRLGWRDALHLVPFAVLVLAALPIYTMSGAEKLAFYQRLRAGERPLLLVIADPLRLLSGVTYAAATLVFLRRHRERVKESYSTVERVSLRWLLVLGGSAAAIWALAVVFQLLESAGIANVGRGDEVVTLAVAALVYATGYMGLRQPEVFRYETAEHAIPGWGSGPAPASGDAGGPPEHHDTADSPNAGTIRARPSSEPAPQPVPGPDPAPRYERSGLTERQAKRLEEALVALMDHEQPWRDSELTLADLAARLSTTPHRLSEVLNAQLGQSFYDFVNGYRVREVQRRIAAGDAERVTMLALALDAGFASKSTFNLVFKKQTGQTPSDFRQGAAV